MNRVRLGKPDDAPALVELGLDVLTKSVYSAKPNTLKAKQVFCRAVSDKRMLLLVAEHHGKPVGFLLGVLADQWFSDDLYATDLAFYVQPNYGQYAPIMVRRFRNWAKRNPKVTDITLAISSGLDHQGRTGAMYQKLGFAKTGGLHSIHIEKSAEKAK